MALSDEEILPSVVIVVEEADSPTRVGQGHLANARGHTGISKRAVTIVLVKSVALIGQIGDNDVRPAIVIVVGEVHTHTGVGSAVHVDCHRGSEADVFE